MLGAGAVAGFAGDAGVGGGRIKLIFCGGGCGVTAEAQASFVGRDRAASGEFESGGSCAWLAGSDIERLRGVVKADVGFKKSRVLLVDESLTHVA